ncbi:hypothetical protein [Sinorhizobium fredii]|uniref:Uncharacterized protein n=1 Tax=Rhizobium fredii TaxID=380 RepID=A0A844AKX3_RHIFR|nr:hypothetical protein [Sinorhizobium fredii]MQX12791.1 hypothetical protein [Sinorhizobium fredii]
MSKNDLSQTAIRARVLARCVRRCENAQLKKQSANGHFGLNADAPDGGPMKAKETSDFSRRTAFIQHADVFRALIGHQFRATSILSPAFSNCL